MSKLRCGLVGCGRVTVRHVDAWQKNSARAQIVAVCDIRLERAQALGERLGVPAFASAAEMYAAVELDLADVCTPSGDHYERVMEALRHDKHVVVEKPVALRLEHADAMIAEARRRGKILWVAQQNRYNPAVQHTRHTLDAGRLGTPVIGTVRVRWLRDQAYYDGDDWHGTWAMDGGVVSQQAIHHVDALRWFMGEVESVEATCATRLVKMECEDLCVATVRFKSGALGVIEAMTAARPRDIEASVSVLGERGSIVLGGIGMNNVDFWEFVDQTPDDVRAPAERSQQVPSAYGFGHDVLFARVIESILDGGPVEIPGEEGRKALALLHAIYASNERRERVQMADEPQSSRLGLGANTKLQGRV
ncbi:MAG TPA: Gfo/Idh/MocA family oxidoreductase [Gemmatimonadaceae bacterium]|jgi:predicted dehydrogenase